MLQLVHILIVLFVLFSVSLSLNLLAAFFGLQSRDMRTVLNGIRHAPVTAQWSSSGLVVGKLLLIYIDGPINAVQCKSDILGSTPN